MAEAVPIEHDPFEGDGSPAKPYAVPVDHIPIFDSLFVTPFDVQFNGESHTSQKPWLRCP
jgi:hypothetical protein